MSPDRPVPAVDQDQLGGRRNANPSAGGGPNPEGRRLAGFLRMPVLLLES